MKIDLKGKVAVVTGASKGIGLAISQALLEHGVTVAAVSRTSEDLQKITHQQNEQFPGKMFAFPASLEREEECIRVISEIGNCFGQIDILINCAGVSQHSFMDLEQLHREEFERILHTNLNSVLYCTRQTIPYMKQQNQGFILNILSTAAFQSSGGGIAYSASKYAARAVTEGLIEQYKGTGIRVTSISPGPVNTNIWSHKTQPVSEERKKKMLRPEDIAQIAMFLLQLDDNVHIGNITVEPWFIPPKK